MSPHVLPSAAPLSTHDHTRTDDTRIKAVRPLITPALLQEWLPAPEAAQQRVEQSRAAISRVLHGADDRLVVVVGPCSIHDHDQALEYARALQGEAQALQDALLVVMRVYFEKPRTTVGWKGYINDPHLDGSFAINEGLEMARRLLLDVLALGLPVGTEFLDLLSPQFISDLGELGRDRRAHDRKPEPPPARERPLVPRGLQERHRRRREGGRRCHFGRAGAARLHGHDQDGAGRDFRDARQRDCHVILRGGRQPNYGPPTWTPRASCCRPRGCARR
jgi:phospho-2-dehydro-3-deoxyheptonate aldolase